MESKINEIVYDVELLLGEAFSIPKTAPQILGPGHWRVSIKPVNMLDSGEPPRDHAGFLNSYSPEDEGLYDDCSAG